MAKSEISIHEGFFGGYEGTLRMPPALTWSDQEALQRSAEGAMESAATLNAVRVGIGALVESVRSLEVQLGLRLDAQTRLLDQQLDVLASIDAALRRPGQVSAAERIANTGELLRRGRYERALRDAEQAIEDDPNNPAGFVAAGWAALGLRSGEAALGFFREAADASDGDDRSRALRQAARLCFALQDGESALRMLHGLDDAISELEGYAVSYDRAVYLSAVGHDAAAAEALGTALAGDERFASAVFADEVLRARPALCQMAASAIGELVDTLAAVQVELTADLDEANASLNTDVGLPTPAAVQKREALEMRIAELRAAPTGPDEPRLRTRLPVLRARRDQAATLLTEARTWPAFALSDRQAMEAEERALREADEALETQRLAAQRARDFEDEVRRFAAQRAAVPTLKPDGSWMITKDRRFGVKEAWRARLDDAGRFAVDSVPWVKRHDWD